MYHQGDTIAAVASAAGGGARGIVRISGPKSRDVVQAAFQSADAGAVGDRLAPWRVPGHLRMEVVRRGLVCLPADLFFWPGNRSYTREPLAELHAFGAEPLLAAALRAVCAAGARPAEPGEFTLRAFLAGRIDLAQAEAVLGVIDAAGRDDLDVALEQLSGGLTGPLRQVRERLLDLLAHLEAGLDFVEEDIEFITFAELAEQLTAAIEQVSSALAQMDDRTLSADTPRVVLFGRPNVGKSSLFNALCRADAALVADLAGTTRDYVTATLELAGCRCELIDTAGVDDSPAAAAPGAAMLDAPWHERASHEAASHAGTSHDAASPAAAAQRSMATQRGRGELGLLCLDASRPLDAWERDQLAKATDRVIVVLTKHDCALPAADLPCASDFKIIATSARARAGLDALRIEIGRRLASLSRREGRAVLATAERARDSLASARQSLTAALETHRARAGEELVAAETRAALDALGQVTGAIASDDILDRVFSRFCIGK